MAGLSSEEQLYSNAVLAVPVRGKSRWVEVDCIRTGNADSIPAYPRARPNRAVALPMEGDGKSCDYAATEVGPVAAV